ncbi:TPA: hypothetical protein EYP12_05945, partial [Candidatus Bipolaricaulota bacterium]|nr:hypothetical protein [Candidatus Bipolaricaulota bacterium]
MEWITREHGNVDRVACPWLIKRFIDQEDERGGQADVGEALRPLRPPRPDHHRDSPLRRALRP